MDTEISRLIKLRSLQFWTNQIKRIGFFFSLTCEENDSPIRSRVRLFFTCDKNHSTESWRCLIGWTWSLTAQTEVQNMNENRFAVIYGSTEDYIDGLDNKNMNTATSTAGQMPMEFFAGALIHGGQCTS